MLTKRTVIAALVAINAILFATLLFTADWIPQARAQRRGAAFDYVAVTARADNNYDALYILDLPQRKLHAFLPNRNRSGQVAYAGNRDLAADFSR